MKSILISFLFFLFAPELVKDVDIPPQPIPAVKVFPADGQDVPADATCTPGVSVPKNKQGVFRVSMTISQADRINAATEIYMALQTMDANKVFRLNTFVRYKGRPVPPNKPTDEPLGFIVDTKRYLAKQYRVCVAPRGAMMIGLIVENITI